MSEIPRISGKEAIRVFCLAGFQHVRTRGSHFILKKKGHFYALSIPVHQNKDIGVGLLDKQIKASGLTLEEFVELLNQ